MKAKGTLIFDLNDEVERKRYFYARTSAHMACALDEFLDYLAVFARTEAEETDISAKELFYKIYEMYKSKIIVNDLVGVLRDDIQYLFDDSQE